MKKGLLILLTILILPSLVCARPELSVNLATEKGTSNVGEDIVTTLSIYNSGDSSTVIKVVIILPTGAVATNPITGVLASSGNMNIGEDELEPGESSSMTFSITPKEEKEYTVIGIVKYTDGDLEREIQVSTDFNAVKPPQTVSSKTLPPATTVSVQTSQISESQPYTFGGVNLLVILGILVVALLVFRGREKVVEREKVILREIEEILPQKCLDCGAPFKGRSGDACEHCGIIIRAEKRVRKVE